MLGSISRTFLQSPSSSSKSAGGLQAVLGEELVVVVEVFRHGVGRDAEVLAVDMNEACQPSESIRREAARRCAELA